MCIGGRKINLCRALAGQHVGIREVADTIWPASFMDYDLGFFDEDEIRVEPAENPFAPKVLPMSSV
jgi:putative transposase